MIQTNRGMVTDIQRASIHDGPGLRTTVFLKGCPLRCAWCHNPESISPKQEMLLYPEHCIGCGQCDSGCYTGARVLCGQLLTVEEVMREVRQDAPFYSVDGGVTLSGGEPLMQPAFVAGIIDACRKENISVAVETSLFMPWEQIAPVLGACSLVMVDVKAWDNLTHKQFTGQPNRLIIENFSRLDSLGIPLIVRTPVIPGVNAAEAEISAIAQFASTLTNLMYYELLPYHPLGLSKAQAVEGFQIQTFEKPSAQAMQTLVAAAKRVLCKPVMVAGIMQQTEEEIGC